MGTYVGATADVEQPLNSPGGEDFDVTRGTQRRSRGEPSIKDTKVYKSGQAESGAPPTATTVTQYVIKGALVFFAAVSVALVMLGMVISPAGARLVHLRTEAMLLVRGQLGPVNMHVRSWGGPPTDRRVSIAVSNVMRILALEDAAPSGYKYAYQSEPLNPKHVNQLCTAVEWGATAFDLDFKGGPLKLGSRTANITETSLCDSFTGGSISFTFDHAEAGKKMYGWSATGQVLCTSAGIGQSTCEFSASAFIVNGTGSDGQPLREEVEVCPVAELPPAVSPAFKEEWPIHPDGSDPDLPRWTGYNAAVVRHDGGLVVAFREWKDIKVADLDDSYVPKGPPTLFNSTDHPHNLSSYQDPRLFVHRGELYMLVHGKHFDRHHGWMYIARLERVPAGADTGVGTAGPAGGFRLVQPRRLDVPEHAPPGLIASEYMENLYSKPPVWEKNWVPFIYEDSIHFMHDVNPPLVLRVTADLPASDAEVDISEGIPTEWVTDDSAASVRWRYGDMRGGSAAVFDAELGGYVAAFHSQVNFQIEDYLYLEALKTDPNATPTEKHQLARKYYYMGFYVFAPQPPFSIQLMSERPVVGVGFYADNVRTQPRHIIFPEALEIVGEDYIVSFGKDDNDLRAARFARREMLETLQPPLPENWEGPPC